jgi:uncharacterized protein (TIGR03084 family)
VTEQSATSQRAGPTGAGHIAAAPPDTTKAAVLQTVVADLAGETDSLVTILARLGTADWSAPTPAEGWTIRDQVTHLAFFDDATLLAMNDPSAFAGQRAELLALGAGFPDAVAARYRHLAGEQCLAWFSRSRAALLAAYRGVDPNTRLPWYGPDMGPASSATGRLMETWAHGQDVADTTGERREPAKRLRHVADLGVRTFAFCFRLRGRPVPAVPIRVELDAPGGELWTWGAAAAEDRVTGTALDFCLVVTQRRNVADTSLRVTGSAAAEWIMIAQAFAGAPTDGRPAGLFAAQPAGGRP